MDKLSLAALLEGDREQVLANLAADRSLPVAQAVLEKAVDRVMYRYVEACGDPALGDSAQAILQAMKNTLPVMDTVGEARTWQKQVETARRGKLDLSWKSAALLVVGALLVLATALAGAIGSRTGGPLAFLRMLLPAALGGAALFWGGILAARPPKRKAEAEGVEATRTEYLVDVEKAWHCLRGAMLQADGQLERLREESEARAQSQARGESRGEPGSDELDLFAELLEAAYAAGDENAREAASAIRFHLHNAGVDVVDCGEGRENWFEFLPAARPGTIRPALVSGGRLLKKGLAAH